MHTPSCSGPSVLIRHVRLDRLDSGVRLNKRTETALGRDAVKSDDFRLVYDVTEVTQMWAMRAERTHVSPPLGTTVLGAAGKRLGTPTPALGYLAQNERTCHERQTGDFARFPRISW
jgi:hypothetical protein